MMREDHLDEMHSHDLTWRVHDDDSFEGRAKCDILGQSNASLKFFSIPRKYNRRPRSGGLTDRLSVSESLALRPNRIMDSKLYP
jgi:hypothetical protein